MKWWRKLLGFGRDCPVCGEIYDIDDAGVGTQYVGDGVSKIVCKRCGDSCRSGSLPWWIVYHGKGRYSVHEQFVVRGHDMHEAEKIIREHGMRLGILTADWKVG